MWIPEDARVNDVIVKNAVGHVFCGLNGMRLSNPARVWAKPVEAMSALERAEFESVGAAEGCVGWPEVGSQSLERKVRSLLAVGSPWIVVQEEIYRYKVVRAAGVFVRSVLWEYLATEVYWGPTRSLFDATHWSTRTRDPTGELDRGDRH